MFKKPLSNVKTSAPLRSSDRRKLKQRVIQTYDISPEVGDLLVPDGLMSQKVATYTNDPGVIYLSPEGDPLWFSVGKGVDDLIPTVYTLWKKYDLLPWISTPESVIHVLVGGADLMIPGVVRISSPTVSPQQLISIVQRTDGSPSTCRPPLAVGRLAVDLDTLKAGAKGKAVNVLHTWKDHLFDMGNKSDPPGEIEIKVDSEDKVDGASTLEQPGTQEGQEPGPNAVQNSQANDLRSEPVPLSGSEEPVVITQPSTSTPNPPVLSKEEVSDILRVSVLQAIQTTLNPSTSTSFPIAASTFYSSYILPFRPAYIRQQSSSDQSQYPQIDIKHSSYKSLLAFFKFLDKQRILTLKDMKPEPLVMSVSASHPDVAAHQPYTSLRDVQLKEEKREQKEEEEKSQVKEMEVKELWKPHAPSGSARFFSEGGFDSSALYSYSDLKAAVNEYVAARQLVNPRDKSYINVWADEALLTSVYGKGEAPESLEFLKREDVVKRLSEKMQSWYEVHADGKDPVLKKGQLKPISVVVKVRQGRKASTMVTGFEPFFLEAEEMAEELKRLCACATSVSPTPGKASGMEVLVQGKQIKAVMEFLLSRGVPKKWIESADLNRKK